MSNEQDEEKRKRGKEKERGRRKGEVECIIKEESRQNRMLNDFACQFYIIENESERERGGGGKRNRIKKETGG